ncbi:hypothetical protein LINPERHAP1_LOCUS36720, partial [Linum perenne]
LSDLSDISNSQGLFGYFWLRVCLGGSCWHFRDSSITPSLELRLTNCQDLWNQDDETDVLGQNSGDSFRLRRVVLPMWGR